MAVGRADAEPLVAQPRRPLGPEGRIQLPRANHEAPLRQRVPERDDGENLSGDPLQVDLKLLRRVEFRSRRIARDDDGVGLRRHRVTIDRHRAPAEVLDQGGQALAHHGDLLSHGTEGRGQSRALCRGRRTGLYGGG